MQPEDRSKLQSLISDLEGLKPKAEDSKFKDWKEKIEKKLEELFGKGSDPVNRFRRIRFFDFGRGGKPKDAPLSESERREYLQRLDEAKRILQGML